MFVIKVIVELKPNSSAVIDRKRTRYGFWRRKVIVRQLSAPK